jgi:hypothetical protein
MRTIWVLVLVACTEPTSLEGEIPCGGMTCGSGQICFSMESGSRCGVDPDAGIGEYQQYGWRCQVLPEGCGGVTEQCYDGLFESVSEDGRYVVRGCI